MEDGIQKGRFIMITRRKFALIVSAVVLFSVLAGGTIGLFAQSRSFDQINFQLRIFSTAFKQVLDRYVTAPDPQKLIYGAIKGMMETLDPHSVFMDAKTFRDLKSSTQGSFGGIGIQIGVRDEVLTVIAPMAGTPASRMGIQAGDRIVKIEGKPTKGITSDEAVGKLRGEPGSNVTITIEREGVSELMDYTITRALIEIESIPYYGFIADKIGYVWLANFSQKSGPDLSKALQDLEKQGMKQLILDLRSNPGGLLNEAVEVSSNFLDNGSLVVFTRGRLKESDQDYKASGQVLFGPKKGSMVVLVNQGSASASEIVAGAVQDWDRALVLGQTSFGKGSVQNVMPLGDSIAIKLTTAKYYTPSGRCIHRDNSAWQSGDLDSLVEDSTASQEVYATLGGLKRKVYGGGGITPDIKVDLPRLNRFQMDLERKTVFFKFAIKYTVGHSNLPKDLIVDESMVDEFTKLLKEDKIEYTPEEFKESRDYVKQGIKRELLSKLYGDKARTAYLLQNDAQAQKAVELLQKNKDLTKLLKEGQNGK
ncbi:MAG: hypothetical protein A2509_03330 [Candidatus Edwardsbacteria bacterium RIFOXYD12_FULL_50_11]|uniref:PDZ domain-containing protein n=1 Tax=Candidatus Edwardsbacteria bacterium GWF2_54_11 TaxID=1817851 RepID=A0A1F5R929_9BACT|nr:MAG: hypothetical protein A2502_03245 [Candidatus Edwardsbacteria bacterium RifOxyC12_full_54_24]OGF07730.1 MAG: hypothetical protein A2273_04495 [Candidatus Edwardsbacteria bacterium RifOxyA12_full_54_48]OGF09980.1 MAG: hypothetical protein A3K15_10905 [Candidatus Edwardsbacteria bacterium GWE2_54_12]OGF10551.1 MAG: hypothetical protein A2024_09405 [Candidatus Edwardsbacteria bacterium GWF2_54_11]OGF14890.1 MAG: hypothetical protein A2509_03330 [Candidatus Edwardsbacteria bacterium RIFOXYD1